MPAPCYPSHPLARNLLWSSRPQVAMPVSRRPAALHSRPARRLRALGLLFAVLALARTSPAQASPGLEGIRHLGMGGASRASSRGTGAMLVNPANLGFTRQFEIAPAYQVRVEDNTHGVGFMAMDSLNNERIALGLGYIATVGGPKITYDDVNGDKQTLQLVHGGHEVGMPISLNAVLGWLAFGIRPKFQFSSLRFRDADGARQEVVKDHTAFGLDAAMTISFRQYVTVSVVGQNLTGPAPPATTLNLAPLVFNPLTLDRSRVSPVSDYPRTLAHALAVFPTRSAGFSLNFDGLYDFTSYRTTADKFTRMVFAGGAEYTIRNIVPLRIGGSWDSRGRGTADDRGYIAFGLGFTRPATKGSVGFDLGVGFSRQITGPNPETVLGINLGLLLNPAF